MSQIIFSRILSLPTGLDSLFSHLEKKPFARGILLRMSRRDENGIISPSGTAWQLFKIVTAVMSLCVLAGLVIPGMKIGSAFGEGDLMTWFSFFALIAAGRLSDRIWRSCGSKGKNDDSFVWRLFYIFFTYLAFDELLRIHETIDNLTHRILGLRPTSLTDHLDDAIVGLYGVIGLCIVIRFRRELLSYLCSLKYLAVAAGCAIATVGLDFLSSSKPFLKSLVADPANVQQVIDILDVFEEWFKVYSEIFFICAFLAVLAVAGRAAKPEFSKAGVPVNDTCVP